MNKPILYLFVFFITIFFNSQKIVYPPEKMNEVEFYCQYTNHPEIVTIINNINQYYQIELPLLIAMAKNESAYNIYAVNLNNVNGSIDRGLYQLNSNYFNSPHIFDPVVNISNGTAHLKSSLKKSQGDIRNALRLYNGGYYKRNPRTEKYCNAVMRDYEQMKMDYWEYKNEK